MKTINNCRIWRSGVAPFRPHTIDIDGHLCHVQYGQVNMEYYYSKKMTPYAIATDTLGNTYTVYANRSRELMTAFPNAERT